LNSIRIFSIHNILFVFCETNFRICFHCFRRLALNCLGVLAYSIVCLENLWNNCSHSWKAWKLWYGYFFYSYLQFCHCETYCTNPKPTALHRSISSVPAIEWFSVGGAGPLRGRRRTIRKRPLPVTGTGGPYGTPGSWENGDPSGSPLLPSNSPLWLLHMAATCKEDGRWMRKKKIWGKRRKENGAGSKVFPGLVDFVPGRV
jgi:hypothetical protein